MIGPVPDAPGAFLATAHGSWGILNAPATGRMIREMILDGHSHSHSLDASPFALTRLPSGAAGLSLVTGSAVPIRAAAHGTSKCMKSLAPP